MLYICMYVCMYVVIEHTDERAWLGLFCWAVSVGFRFCEGMLCYGTSVRSSRVVSSKWGGKGEREFSLRFFSFLFRHSSSTFFFDFDFDFDELLVRDTEYDLFPRS